MVRDREILAACLVAERAGQPALPDAGWSDQEQAMALSDPVACRQPHEEIAIKTAGCPEIGVLDLGVMT
ncbi:hypothetical protein GCM10010869_05390 [Mesorhizobium tianshanense]|nr:hypothetical protein GCM10010869_05390 [Mesorhizobium tianshanense]